MKNVDEYFERAWMLRRVHPNSIAETVINDHGGNAEAIALGVAAEYQRAADAFKKAAPKIHALSLKL